MKLKIFLCNSIQRIYKTLNKIRSRTSVNFQENFQYKLQFCILSYPHRRMCRFRILWCAYYKYCGLFIIHATFFS